MDRVEALKKGRIYTEGRYPERCKQQINSQETTKISSQVQISVAKISEEERGPSEELMNAFGSIVLKDNKSQNNQVDKNAESKEKPSRKPLVAADTGYNVNIENLEI